MKCPFCSCEESKVIDSRPTEEGQVIRRRRECTRCNKRFTTHEKVEYLPILVIKKDGRREAFESEKLKIGLMKACEKRPIAIKDLDALVDDVEKFVYNSLEQEITSHYLGELIMKRLKELDEVAYVRFASVYRQFKDITTFMDELDKLLKEK